MSLMKGEYYVELTVRSVSGFSCQHSSEISRQDAINICLDPDHSSKASGYPWDLIGLPTKADVVAANIDCDISVVNATLKDEIRLVGKDARLFRMQSTYDYLEGLQLYTSQNEYIMDRLHAAPAFVKYKTPGYDLTLMYTSLHQHGGDFYYRVS